MGQPLTRTSERGAFVLLAIAMAGAAPALATPSAAAAEPPAEPEHVRLEVFADHRSIGPGEPFWVAVVQHIDPHWHTYWVNPGDAGLATQIDWTVPAGYTVGAVEWPLPNVYRSGPTVTYGYAGEVISLQELRAPATLAPGTGALAVDVKWLVCREACIPGRGSTRIVLEQLAAAPGAAEPAAMGRIAAAREALPRPAPWPASATVHAMDVELVVHGAARDLPARTPVRFLPLEWGQIDNAADQVADRNAGNLSLTLRRGDLRDTPLVAIEGLLLVGSEDAGRGGRGYVLHADADGASAPH